MPCFKHLRNTDKTKELIFAKMTYANLTFAFRFKRVSLLISLYKSVLRYWFILVKSENHKEITDKRSSQAFPLFSSQNDVFIKQLYIL